MVDEGYLRHITEHRVVSARDIQIIQACSPGARHIVDLGCGRAGFALESRGQLPDILGLDRLPAAARISRTENLPFLLADVAALPFASASIDVVRAKELIEHLVDPAPVLQEAYCVLRPDGILIVHVPTHLSTLYPVGNFWDDYTHIRPLSRPGVRRLLEDTGFAVISVKGYTAGRNLLERCLGRLLALLAPHTWLALARKPGRDDAPL